MFWTALAFYGLIKGVLLGGIILFLAGFTGRDFSFPLPFILIPSAFLLGDLIWVLWLFFNVDANEKGKLSVASLVTLPLGVFALPLIWIPKGNNKR